MNPSNPDTRTSVELEREAFLNVADEAAAPIRAQGEQLVRAGRALYRNDTLLKSGYFTAYDGATLKAAPLADRLGMTAEHKAADFAELVGVADTTGLDLREFMALEAAERGSVHDRTLRGQPAVDPIAHAERLAKIRQDVRYRYGQERGEQLFKRAEAFIAAHPGLAKRLAVGTLRSEPGIMHAIVAHVSRTHYGAKAGA